MTPSRVAFAAILAKDLRAELRTLQSLQHKIIRMQPRSEEDRIHEELAASIASENYEHAARLRDRLKKLGKTPF